MAEEEGKKKTAQTVTAEELAKEFKEHSVAEFFKKNMQMLGLTGKIKTLTTIIHEYISNSLDACEAANILPDIEVKISEMGNEFYEVVVTDNGPGLTQETVGKAFGKLLAGTKFHRLVQMRGQQGIGASGVTMLSQMTTGQETKVITGTGKQTIAVDISIDTKHNEPKMSNLQVLAKAFQGTAVKAKFKDVKYVNSEQGPLEYLRRVAIANPHAKITFISPEKEKVVFERNSKLIPKPPIEGKPHPKGVSVDDINTMSKRTQSKKVSSFLKTEFERIGDTSLSELQKLVSFDLNKDPKQLAWQEAEEIVKAFKKINFIAPSVDTLRPIGEEHIEKSLRSIVKPEFLSVVTRKPAVFAGGFPFQVEVAVAFGGEAGRVGSEKTEEGTSSRKIEIMRFANRTPLLFDSGGCAITKSVQTVDWKRYGIKDLDSAPLTVFCNLISVHIPYTSAGKQAISEEPEVLEELRLALMDAGRKTARYIIGKERDRLKLEKKRQFMKYAKEVALAIGSLTGKKPGDIETKLLDIVVKKLKIEEAQEEKEKKKIEEASDAELEKDLAKLQKEAKEATKKGKKKKGGEDEGGGED